MLYAMNLQLNIKLVESEMERAGFTKDDLRKRWKLSRTIVYYIWNEKPVSYANRFGRLFNRPAKDFVL
jgi:hypothetical protein